MRSIDVLCEVASERFDWRENLSFLLLGNSFLPISLSLWTVVSVMLMVVCGTNEHTSQAWETVYQDQIFHHHALANEVGCMPIYN